MAIDKMTYAHLAARKAGRAGGLIHIEEDRAVPAPAAAPRGARAQPDIANGSDVDACDVPSPPPYDEADQYPTLQVPSRLEQELSGATQLGRGGQAAVFALAGGDVVLKVGYALCDEEADQVALQLRLARDYGISHPAALLPTDAFVATLDGTFALPGGAALPGAPRMWHNGAAMVLVTLMPRVWGETLAELCEKLDCAELAAKLAQRLGDADAASDLAAVREARERAAREVLRSLVPLLVQAAQAGVMHGDIKLENIMVDEDLAIKLLDWGLCRNFDTTQACPIAAELCGTLEYFAPEMLHAATGDKPCARSAALDFWALGVLLVKLLSGQHLHPYYTSKAFDAVGASLAACGQQGSIHCWAAGLSRLLRRCPPGPCWPAGVREELSPELVEVVEGLLQQDPARRMGLEELQARVDGLVGGWDTPQAAAAAAEPSAATGAATMAARAMPAAQLAPTEPTRRARKPAPSPLACVPEASSGSSSLSPSSCSSSVPYHSASPSVVSSAASSTATSTSPPQLSTGTDGSCGCSFIASSASSDPSFSRPCSSPAAPATPERVSDHGVPTPSAPGRDSRDSLASPCLTKADGPGVSIPCPAAPLATASRTCHGGCCGDEGATKGSSEQQRKPRTMTVWSRKARRWLAGLGACWGRA